MNIQNPFKEYDEAMSEFNKLPKVEYKPTKVNHSTQQKKVIPTIVESVKTEVTHIASEVVHIPVRTVNIATRTITRVEDLINRD